MRRQDLHISKILRMKMLRTKRPPWLAVWTQSGLGPERNAQHHCFAGPSILRASSELRGSALSLCGLRRKLNE